VSQCFGSNQLVLALTYMLKTPSVDMNMVAVLSWSTCVGSSRYRRWTCLATPSRS